MNKRILAYVLATMFICAGNAWSAFYTEGLIYTGPPENDEVYEFSESAPVHVSSFHLGKDAEANGGYWSIGGRLSNTWNSNYQGWLYSFASMEKEFRVTAPGSVSISFNLSGSLQVTADSNYDGHYSFYGYGAVEDLTLGVHDDVYWEPTQNSSGNLAVSEDGVFNYTFDASDVGDLFSINLTFETMVLANDFTIAPEDQLIFNSEFVDGLKFTNVSGAIEAVDNGPEGPTPVPIPPAMCLLATGLISAIGIRSKFAKE